MPTHSIRCTALNRILLTLSTQGVDYVYITMTRDPVAREISHYIFNKEKRSVNFKVSFGGTEVVCVCACFLCCWEERWARFTHGLVSFSCRYNAQDRLPQSCHTRTLGYLQDHVAKGTAKATLDAQLRSISSEIGSCGEMVMCACGEMVMCAWGEKAMCACNDPSLYILAR